MTRKAYLIFASALFAVLIGTGAIYWQGLDGPFLLDDFTNIFSAYVDYFDKDEILYALTHNGSGDLGRPVSVMSLLFSGIVHGLVPWGYKFHNLAIHLINGLLVFWLLFKLLPRLSPGLDENRTVLISGFTATIWLLHPLLVSTVLYAVQRMAQLSALFTLAALITYVSVREESVTGGWKFYVTAYLLFTLFFVLAVFSKENGLLIPFYLLVIEMTVFRFRFESTGERNRAGIFLALFAVIPILVGSLYLLTHFGQFSDYSMRNFTMGERLLTELHVVTLYVKMILLPRLADMTLYHDYIRITQGFDPVTIFLLLLWTVMAALVVYLREKAPVAAFAIGWFIVSHLMESTFIDLELMFEHRNYLAAAGPLFAVVFYISNQPVYPKLKYLNIVIILLLAFMTLTRVNEWRSSELIYQVAVTEHPDSERALVAMANTKYRERDIGEALRYLQAVQELNKKEFGAFAHEAVYRCGTGEDLEYLFEEARERARLNPVTAYDLNAVDNLIGVLNRGGCTEISMESVLSLIQAAKSQEDNRNNQRFLGFLEKQEGEVDMLMGSYQDAVGLLLSAYQRTGMVQILANLAENMLQLERLEDAELVIKDIENINEESRGTETAVLKPLQEKLQAAKAHMALADSKMADEGTSQTNETLDEGEVN